MRDTIRVPPTDARTGFWIILLSDFLNLKENVLVSHPSGSFSFGTIPEMPKFALPGGEIYLRVGVHKGDNKGYGIRHIWEAHQKDLSRYG